MRRRKTRVRQVADAVDRRIGGKLVKEVAPEREMPPRGAQAARRRVVEAIQPTWMRTKSESDWMFW